VISGLLSGPIDQKPRSQEDIIAETLEEKKARLKAQKDAISKKLKEIDSREKSAERKLRTQRLIFFGAALEKIAQQCPEYPVTNALEEMVADWAKLQKKKAEKRLETKKVS
jgi:hypothetical protein